MKQIEDMNRMQENMNRIERMSTQSITQKSYGIPKTPAGYNPPSIQQKKPAIPQPSKVPIKE
jgi:hypothetical protein